MVKVDAGDGAGVAAGGVELLLDEFGVGAWLQLAITTSAVRDNAKKYEFFIDTD